MGLGFVLQDEEPCPFDGSLVEIVEPLRGAKTDSFPRSFQVSTPDGKKELVVTSIEEEHMEPGDMMLKGHIGKDRWPVEIWWDQELEQGHVDSSCLLAEALEILTKRWDALPSEDRSSETVEIHEVSELEHAQAAEIIELLFFGDSYEQLDVICLISSACGKDAELEEVLRERTKFDALQSQDANGDALQKFVLGPMKAQQVYSLLHLLSAHNEENELKYDLVIYWQETSG